MSGRSKSIWAPYPQLGIWWLLIWWILILEYLFGEKQFGEYLSGEYLWLAGLNLFEHHILSLAIPTLSPLHHSICAAFYPGPPFLPFLPLFPSLCWSTPVFTPPWSSGFASENEAFKTPSPGSIKPIFVLALNVAWRSRLCLASWLVFSKIYAFDNDNKLLIKLGNI